MAAQGSAQAPETGGTSAPQGPLPPREGEQAPGAAAGAGSGDVPMASRGEGTAPPEGRQEPAAGSGAAHMQVDQEADDGAVMPGRPPGRGAKRALVRPPGERTARTFSVSLQGPGRSAACKKCGEAFKEGQPRINLQSDASCGRYQHLHCLEALRRDDTLQGMEGMPRAVHGEIAEMYAAGREPEPEGGEVQLPLAQIPRTMQAEAEHRGMNWWSGRSWSDAKRLQDRKSTRLNSSHSQQSRMPSSA